MRGVAVAISGFDEVFEEIRADGQNAEYTAAGIDPLYFAGPDARIMVVGQAPGRIAQDTHIVWNDKSGDRLRDWLGCPRFQFFFPNFSPYDKSAG